MRIRRGCLLQLHVSKVITPRLGLSQGTPKVVGPFITGFRGHFIALSQAVDKVIYGRSNFLHMENSRFHTFRVSFLNHNDNEFSQIIAVARVQGYLSIIDVWSTTGICYIIRPVWCMGWSKVKVPMHLIGSIIS